ncbi:MAG: vitamin K epoxide reductase family protein [Planctomycetota bacterium]
MPTPPDRSPLDTALVGAGRLLAFGAVGLAGYLWYAGAQQTGLAGCDFLSDFDCDAALASRWAKWFGLPVSALGGLVYLSLIAGSVLIAIPRLETFGWRVVEAASVAAVGAAVWFVAVQFFALDSYCLYCLATHACGLLGAAALFGARARRAAATDAGPAAAMLTPGELIAAEGPPPLGPPLAVGVLGVAALAAGQLFGAAPGPERTAAFEAPEDLAIAGFDEPEVPRPRSVDTSSIDDAGDTESAVVEDQSSERQAAYTLPPRRRNGSRRVKFLRDRLTIDAYTHPVVGSPEAPHLMLELMDYACPHCRKFHDVIAEAIDRRRGQVGVVVMPVPGEILCNPYVKRGAKERRGACRIAKLSIAVSELEPEAFEPMHRWLLEGDRLPNYTSALLEARRFVDADTLSFKLRDDSGDLAARVKRHIELYATLASIQKIGLPTMVLGSNVYAGGVKTVDELVAVWDENFGLDPADFGEPPADGAIGE